MLENISKCPICGGEELSIFLKTNDFSITKEEFTLSSCKACHFVFTNPRPNENDINRYYESADYISHSNSNQGLFNKIYQLVKNISLKNKLDIIESYSNSNKTLLDVGCGTGSFLNYCIQHGWSAIGMEPNKNAREVGRKEYNLSISDRLDIDSLQPESFQIITLWHVLEHVHLLRKRIEEIAVLLKPKGKLIIALPNRDSFDSRHFKTTWAAYDVPRHLYHFSAQNVKDLFHQYSFKHIESLPMKFDSMYVSILSEKYMNKSFPFIRGLYNGLKSNILASNNPEKYSSVIYVFEKI